jgi:hypothetical protein
LGVKSLEDLTAGVRNMMWRWHVDPAVTEDLRRQAVLCSGVSIDEKTAGAMIYYRQDRSIKIETRTICFYGWKYHPIPLVMFSVLVRSELK